MSKTFSPSFALTDKPEQHLYEISSIHMIDSTAIFHAYWFVVHSAFGFHACKLFKCDLTIYGVRLPQTLYLGIFL
jgi:hypothetical protein